MEHRFLQLFVDGKWMGKKDRSISVDGVKYNMDEYAKAHGIELPEGKKQINTDVEEKHEDMERSHDSGHTDIDGDGNSESTE